MKSMGLVGWIAFILVIIGALNWGLYGAFDKMDLVSMLLGDYTMAARIVYVLVGLAAIYLIIIKLKKMGKAS